MSLKVPDVGELAFLLDHLAGNLAGAELCLFQNNATVNDATTLAGITEADFDGYAREPLATHWGTPGMVAGRASVDTDLITFTKAAGATTNNIYGYYVVDSAGDLLFLEKDPAAPIAMSTTGDTYSVKITFTEKSEF